jgi:hypothetical protein
LSFGLFAFSPFPIFVFSSFYVSNFPLFTLISHSILLFTFSLLPPFISNRGKIVKKKEIGERKGDECRRAQTDREHTNIKINH